MSAFLVNSDTLDLIASVAATWSQESHIGGVNVYQYITDEKPLNPNITQEINETVNRAYVKVVSSMARDIKFELLLENVRSLKARYSDDWWDGQEIEPFRNICRGDVDYSDVLGALACYEYQACESNEWDKSFAHALIQATRRKVCSMISQNSWEYTRPSVKVGA